MSFTIRNGDAQRDRALMQRFVMGLQAFEWQIAPNRRLYPAVAEEHLVQAFKDSERPFGIFIAEDAAGGAIGWALVMERGDQIYVVPELRRYAYIAELYLEEAARGTGAGRALLAACEDWARAGGYPFMEIGVLAGNGRARKVYADAGFAPYSLELRKKL
jgi:GNAT superfamily N-acetyltransferase